MNRPLKLAVSAIFLAQFLKIPIKYLRTKKWEWNTFFETGGMPSSHSAGVTTLATIIAVKRGFKTIDFALASIFGLIVMYDAQGVRRQTGEITLAVNDLAEKLDRLEGKPDINVHDKLRKRLKERLGHQPEEVLGGALFGILYALIGMRMIFKKKKLELWDKL
ncbi:Divergent PAP2 family protein [Bacillus sp. THAF10]|uniref:divergent PAP2 family protein n=1 Tax=Bacillus sp. THAF10 TaxID=2587848 RepID=UPI0012679045|nr:divergent PAP2 family protein [Bacillus sp. THAF10]QFT89327.1 Divergent PAP2 family protein [Bacillus sp. THAF10]